MKLGTIIEIIKHLKKVFKINSKTEELVIIILGIVGIIALVTDKLDIATFCLGALVGYLTKGHVEYKRTRK
jgi:hypothetical protein